MALTQISTDGIKNGTITGSDLATSFATTGDFNFTGDNANILFDKDNDNIRVFDNASIDFGQSGDLKIHHSGHVNIIDDVQSKNISIRRGGSENWVFGDATFKGPDNRKIQLGNAEDLQIFHAAGAASHINATGLLNIDGTTGVRLEYNNATRLETTSGGVEIPDGSVLTVQTTSTSNGFLSFLDTGNVGYEWKFPDNSTVQFGTNHGSDKRLQLNNEDASSHFHFSLADNGKMLFGNNDDLQIYHDGSDSFIVDQGTGRLNIRTNGDSIKLQNTDGGTEAMGIFNSNGSVELYHNGSKKFETKSFGVQVTGELYSDGLRAGDNERLRLGDGEDLQIYHDPQFGHSFIKESGSGGLIFGASLYEFYNAAISEKMLTANQNGAVELYYDNSLKLDTRSSGVGISGNLFMVDSTVLYLGSSNDFQLFHDGTNSHIVNSTGNLVYRSDTHHFKDKDNGDTHAKFVHDGAVELYYDNSKKFETSSSGVQIADNLNMSGGHIFLADNYKLNVGTGDDLQISHDGTSSLIKSPSHPIAHYSNTRHHFLNADGSENVAVFVPGGQCELYHNGTKKFETTSKGIKVEGAQANGELGVFHATGSTFQSCTLQSVASRNTTNHTYLHFKCSINGVADKMHVRDSGDVRNTNNSYGSISDISLKENIVDAGSQWDDIKNIRVRKFNFKSLTDPDQKTMLGVVAQEAELICPNLVDTEVSLQEGEEKEYKSFKYSVLYMKAIKCLQEAMAKIEVLETEVAALKAA